MIVGNCVYGNSSYSCHNDKFCGQQKILSMATSDSAIWITNKVEPFIQMNNTGVTGNYTSQVVLSVVGKCMCVWVMMCGLH